MNYSSKIQQSKEKVYYHAIATKIRDMIAKLRKSANEDRKRRWIWELLQNAKDVAYENQDTIIKIDFKTNPDKTGILEFKHNGKPFSVDDITFLIEQVSTKDKKTEEGEQPKSIGKFGTGFLTTHLLSEKVEIESVIKEPDLPYRKFKLYLDRSGREIEEIIDSVNNSLGLLNNLDSEPPYNEFIESDYNTTFRYKLDEKGIDVARIGMKDLHDSIPYTLVFSEKIKEIKIVNTNISYRLLPEINNLENGIKIFNIRKSTNNNNEVIKLVVLRSNLTSVSIEIENKNNLIYIKKFNSTLPRLFCDFPLIGSEEFYFPTIINNPSFSPTEPRDGIDLADSDDSDIIRNKQYIAESIELYYLLLDYASKNNWQNIFYLAQIISPKDKDWISIKWFEKSVLKPIRTKLLKSPIIDIESGARISICNNDDEAEVYFPYGNNSEIREKIWELTFDLYPDNLPKKNDIEIWNEIIWSGCYKLTVEELTKDIQNTKTIISLSEKIKKIEVDTIAWLNKYYDLLNFEGSFINNIINGTYCVIPNQNGIFSKKSELFWDTNIEEELKNVLEILGVEIRNKLRNKNIYTKSKYTDDKKAQITHYENKQENIIEEINKIIKEGKNDKISNACDYLTTIFPSDLTKQEQRELMFQFCKKTFPDDFVEKRIITNWDEKIWYESDRLEIRYIQNFISEKKNIQNLSLNLNFDSLLNAKKWLMSFIEFLVKQGYENLLNLKNNPILPNQNGDFVCKDDLFLDNGEIDNTLKDIAFDLGLDIRDELLDINIFLELPNNRTRNQFYIASEITKLLTPKIAELSRTDETKIVCSKLYMWFNKNKSIAKEIFHELYLNKHRLYNDDEIAENIQKAELLTDLMTEFKISDIQSLRKTLLASQESKEDKIQPNLINQETLVSLGVSSIEELEKALENKDIASNFIHITTPTIEMFLYAQKLIERAKKNIIAYIKTIPEYNCDDCEEIAPSVFTGIYKNEMPIYLVTRPSDNGEVIIYYTSEKDILDYANAELWIENGISQPQHLSLGRILKLTGINRIPV